MVKVIGGEPVDTGIIEQQLTRSSLDEDVAQGNVGMVIEHLADADLSVADIKRILAEAARNRAKIKENEASVVDGHAGSTIHNAGDFERHRASALRKFADMIEKS